jgi:prefoldin subunit 5
MLKLKGMPNKDSVNSINSDALNFVVKALTKHEKQISQLISKLDERKDELSIHMEKLSLNLEEITKKLDTIENEIEKLKNILLT